MLQRALSVLLLLGLLVPAVSTGEEKQAAPPADTQQQAAPPAETQWLKDKRGCKFANPAPKPNESVTWSGACADGYMQGKGVLQFTTDGKPGARYEGTLSKGRLTGRGLLRTGDGSTYDGDWVDGKQDGYGVFTAADGSRYEGAWTAGQMDGPGTYRSPKSEIVRGVWENGKLVKRYKD